MPLITIAETIRTASTDSTEFGIALGAIEDLIEAETRTNEQDEALEGYVAAIRDRFRSGDELSKLEAMVGACNVIVLFESEIDLDAASMADGSGAKVNLFAALHLKSCDRCQFLMALKSLQRSLSVKRPACAAQEN